jgi:hypothetical protein
MTVSHVVLVADPCAADNPAAAAALFADRHIVLSN